MLSIMLFLQLQAPLRAVNDSGIAVNAARITPAGLQSILPGRVAGVRFGANTGELWAVSPGGAWRLAWREKRVLGSADTPRGAAP